MIYCNFLTTTGSEKAISSRLWFKGIKWMYEKTAEIQFRNVYIYYCSCLKCCYIFLCEKHFISSNPWLDLNFPCKSLGLWSKKIVHTSTNSATSAITNRKSEKTNLSSLFELSQHTIFWMSENQHLWKMKMFWLNVNENYDQRSGDFWWFSSSLNNKYQQTFWNNRSFDDVKKIELSNY